MRISFFILIACLTACHEPPQYSASAIPQASKGPAPMGSATSNALLKEKAQLLEQMLDGQIELAKIQSAVALANEIDKQKTQTLNADQQKALLVRDLFQRVPAGINAANPLSDPHQKAMIIAQLYFDERRFIEAGHQLSRLLDEAPQYPGARNLLARCFFFLGNQDRTVQELSFVLEQKETQKREILDALFLLGAAVLESQTPSKDSLQKGVAAWETYIEQAPNSPQIPTITKGLAVMKKALEVPIGISPNSRRAQLPENASEKEKLKAQTLDDFETVPPEEALKILKASLKKLKSDPELETALGRTLVRLNDVANAQDVFKKATQAYPKHMPAWHYQGMAFLLGGTPAKAVASWQYVIENDPEYAARFKLDQRVNVAKRMAQ